MQHSKLIFNGETKEWLFLLEGRQKSPFAPITNNLLRVPGKPGAYIQSSKTDVLYINQPVGFIVENDVDALDKLDQLKSWLLTNEPVELQFPDEPDRVYYAKVEGDISDFARFENQRRGTITFICPDPYAYGPEIPYTFPSDYVSVTNEGTHEAKPIFELEVLTPVTFAMIQNQHDEYMMIGKPVDVTTEVVNVKGVLLEERGQTLDTWSASPTSIDGGVVAGTLSTDNDGITVVEYGPDTPNWHGPALIKEVVPTQDFEVEMMLEGESIDTMTYRIEFYLFDEGMNVIGKMAIRDQNVGLSVKDAEGRAGPYAGRGVNYLISSANYSYRWPFFYGMLRLKRIGNKFEFYVTRVANNTKHVYSLKKEFVDTSGAFIGRLKYVQIHIGKYGDTARANAPKIQHIKVFELAETEENQTPYIAYPGDIITFNHKDEEMLLNGENVMRLKDFGARFFELQKGANELVVHPSNVFNVNMTYRETFK